MRICGRRKSAAVFLPACFVLQRERSCDRHVEIVIHRASLECSDQYREGLTCKHSGNPSIWRAPRAF
jgi:hypothetical protein